MSMNPGQEEPFPHGGDGPDDEEPTSIYPAQESGGPVSAPRAPRREGAVPDVDDPTLMDRLQRAAESMPRPGDVFARFQLLRELGSGAFGRVFLAQQPDLAHRPVVLKLSAHFLEEWETLAQLQHTNPCLAGPSTTHVLISSARSAGIFGVAPFALPGRRPRSPRST